jgi:hypothetical protein
MMFVMMFVGSRSALSEPRLPPPCATVVLPAQPTMTIRPTKASDRGLSWETSPPDRVEYDLDAVATGEGLHIVTKLGNAGLAVSRRGAYHLISADGLYLRQLRVRPASRNHGGAEDLRDLNSRHTLRAAYFIH